MDRKYSFTAEIPAARLDRFVAESCPELSRTHAQELINQGHIKVNGQPARASHRLNPGDRVSVSIPRTTPIQILPEALPLDIVYEDEDLMVVDKPAGITAHPSPGHPSHTLLNAILAHFPDLPEGSERLRPGIVHRLDKDTSGLMLVAKKRQSLAHLSDQFKSRSVTKVYLVLVKGRLSPEKGTILAPIGRDTRHRQRMAVATRGREARTDYRVVKYLGNYSLLEVMPETGRTHQIRVHFSAIGYPVVGDATYGVRSAKLARQFVHAHRLGFKLPESGKQVEFTSPLPPDLEQALEDMA
jgi:23S rRNA pseudouridine1911/1915/1917 synthase